MTGGILQLVAYGKQDTYLTKDPQITFFKIIYRRHTLFSREDIIQSFAYTPTFGRRVSCVISRCSGDLVDNMTLKLTLPSIPRLDYNTDIKFAWVKYIGYALIKYIEIEINGNIIDRHYGEWMYIWSTLTKRNIDDGLDKMIGNVPELYNFTTTKDEYILYIPIYFWFCRTPGLALPLISMQYSDIKINIELNELNKCYKLMPSHYINCSEDVVMMEHCERIFQKQTNAYGIYSHYDIMNKRMYYLQCDKYIKFGCNKLITGNTYTVTPVNNPVVVHHKALNIKITDCVLLVGYVFIDTDERMKYAHSRHEYLIEQLYFTPNIKIYNTYAKVKLDINQPCKLIVWIAQLDKTYEANDIFDYTYMDESLIITDTLLLNSQVRVTERPHTYYELIQPYQFTQNRLPPGCGMYSYGIYPLDPTPSGTTNMSQIDLIEINMKLHNCISAHNKVNFRGYGLCYNILRIDNGLCGKLFIN